ncbi:MAG: nicotinate (nicotinamide) nucleotide adenylyltransferase [Eubacterium sp.]|nr:nicotinate (nicotinamide) nucleotide adenylyltransferase [Eubacterium sp.]
MKTGIFGGAFNPFHNGHLHLMLCYLDALQLDRILLIPTSVPPHKTGAYLASGQDRLAMLSLVAKEYPQLTVSDMELRRSGKSYTYDTVCALREQYPEDDFYLIIGSDQFFSFRSWYKATALLQLVTVCTAARNQGEYDRLTAFRRQYDDMVRCVVSDFEVLPLSSTEIRNKIKNGEAVTDCVPPAVANYIKEHGLYV